jgi:acyl carrier protein
MSNEEKLLGILHKISGKSESDIKAATTWAELDFDSLEVVELIMSIEDQFEIEIPDSESDGIKNFDALLTYINNASK